MDRSCSWVFFNQFDFFKFFKRKIRGGGGPLGGAPHVFCFRVPSMRGGGPYIYIWGPSDIYSDQYAKIMENHGESWRIMEKFVSIFFRFFQNFLDFFQIFFRFFFIFFSDFFSDFFQIFFRFFSDFFHIFFIFFS